MSVKEEIEETEKLLQQCTFTGIRAALLQHLAQLAQLRTAATTEDESSHEPDTSSSAAAAPPIPVNETHAPTTSTAASIAPCSRPTATSMPFVSSAAYVPIVSFAWDQAGFSSPNVTVYVDLEGVGAVPDRASNVTCTFGRCSFDLTVRGLGGRCYRLLQDNLYRDIEPGRCSYSVKKNKVVIRLVKAPNEGAGAGAGHFDSWTSLQSKKPREQRLADEAKKRDQDAGAQLQSMLKDMYEDGDDNMRAIIGEAMSKQQGRGGGLGGAL